MEQLSACPICKNTSFSPFLVCKDYTATQETFNIVRCGSCDFVFTNPRPSQDEIARYYQVENYISHTGTQSGIINKLYHFARKFTLKQKLNLVNKLTSKGKLLDIGCGTGNFLQVVKNDGWEVSGVEPDSSARKLAIEICGKEIYDEEYLNNNQQAQFDIISMWHVLEHVHALNQRLVQLKNLLKPNGRLIVAVPNCASFDAAHYKQYWGAYDVPRHLYHFKPADIKKLFEQNLFEVENILPMKLDAFYVSMLSEKYKGGNMLSGVWHGLRSNIQAARKKGTYSSQIYIIKHK
ncbi:MAG: class I SAM-dependent methyltransferase [Bacteroidota bacterium]|jgi:2-polyprenyl-3-methyl-5-hydroxy-6-metoxy-1,4-benzoquinol methylase